MSKITENVKKKLSDCKKKDFVNYGYIYSASAGIGLVMGLANARVGEIVKIYPKTKDGQGPSCIDALVLSLHKSHVSIVTMEASRYIKAGSYVRTTGRCMRMKLNTKDMTGRVITPIGVDLRSNQKPRPDDSTINIEAPAPDILSRQPIFEPLLTGLTVVDGLVPIGRGQRELIIGDRQTGKTSLAIDTILNQTDVVCVYVSIGQKCSSVSQIFRIFEKARKLDNLVIVSATASDAAPLQYLAPYSGCAVAEFFRDNHGDATLVVYDDLTKHAAAYRQMSLLLRRPPGREAFPGDVFYLHSRLLERAAKLSSNLGGGSLTALPIVETQAGDVSAYIPTNVISITDGQIFLDTELFAQGIRPAVNVGLSVSRVGSAAQYPSMKALAGNLKLELAQYREVLGFVKFGSDIDPATAEILAKGERLVEILKQPRNKPNIIELQIILLAFGAFGVFDDFELKDVRSLISLGSILVNFLFKAPELKILTYFFRYLNARELERVVISLLKYVFLKLNKINV